MINYRFINGKQQMLNKIKLLPIFIIGMIVQPFSYAEDDYLATARVVGTTPVIEKLYAPSRKCDHPQYRKARNDGDFIFGALLGGVAGAQVGKGSGRDAAAALGAVLGGNLAAGGGQLTGEELLGAIAGGAIGNTVGEGTGKTAATAAGAVLGNALASGMLSRNRDSYNRVCGRNVTSRNVITGYDVRYEYNGLQFVGRLPYKPDREVDILISAEILEDRTL